MYSSIIFMSPRFEKGKVKNKKTNFGISKRCSKNGKNIPKDNITM